MAKPFKLISQATSFLLPATNLFLFRYRKNAIHSTAANCYHSVNKSINHRVTKKPNYLIVLLTADLRYSLGNQQTPPATCLIVWQLATHSLNDTVEQC
jgi:hypothetical protein